MANKLTMIYKTAATYNRVQVHREDRHADGTTNAQIQIHREDRYADRKTMPQQQKLRDHCTSTERHSSWSFSLLFSNLRSIHLSRKRNQKPSINCSSDYHRVLSWLAKGCKNEWSCAFGWSSICWWTNERVTGGHRHTRPPNPCNNRPLRAFAVKTWRVIVRWSRIKTCRVIIRRRRIGWSLIEVHGACRKFVRTVQFIHMFRACSKLPWQSSVVSYKNRLPSSWLSCSSGSNSEVQEF